MEHENKATVLSDTGSLCRVCLTSNQNNQCMFRTKRNDLESTDTYDLAEKIRLCGGVEIAENDGLPATICTRCTMKVNDAHELRKQCQRADTRLRELYGKFKKKCSSGTRTVTKDQYCQTDCFLTHSIAVESSMASRIDDKVLARLKIENSSFDGEYVDKLKLINESSYEEQESNNCSKTQDVHVKHKQMGYEKIGRETSRTRRTTMFKRVTSMENLKNHKERQRQYIKKNINVKRDSVENDCPANINDTVSGMEGKSESGCPHVCPKCTRCYFSKKSLDRHILTHDEKKFTCEKCNKKFFQLEKLQQHSKLHKSKEKPKPVLCKICNKNFRKTDTMVRHLNVHKRANPKEVLSILKEIRDKRKLENILEHGERISEIAANGKKKATEGNAGVDDKNDGANALEGCILESERKTCSSYSSNSESNADCKFDSFSDASLYRCKHCTKCYATDKSLQRHLLIHDEKKYVCNVCNMKFFRQDRLKSHKNRYGHDEDNTPLETQKPPDDKSAIKLINSWIREELDSDNEGKGFPCKICGKSYDTKKSLLKHQVNAHNTREEGCANCGKTCTCAGRAKDQEKGSERSKPFRCDECNKSFEKEVKLQRHARIHERAKEQQDANFKRFLCHICSKTFRQNTGLMFHMRTHTGYKPHVCKYCGRGFTSNSNCINHERTHTGDRPFVCHFCSAAFAKSCTLKAHITTHTGEANYHCKTCGKSFRRLKYLKEHRFTHTGEKPYACKICGTAYSHSGSLFVHEKKCKAQYNSYQSNSAQNTQSYCQTQASSPTVTPIITVLSQPHLNNVTSTLSAQTSKTYIDNIQRMNSQGGGTATATSGLHVHQNSDISDVSSAVRSFALIGQMFQS